MTVYGLNTSNTNTNTATQCSEELAAEDGEKNQASRDGSKCRQNRWNRGMIHGAFHEPGMSKTKLIGVGEVKK